MLSVIRSQCSSALATASASHGFALLFAVSFTLLFAQPATAQQWNIIGSRAQGMGGAGVGTVNDSSATYWNPAALGYKKKGEWDVQIPLTLNTSIENDMLGLLSGLLVDYEDLQTTFDALQSGTISDPVAIANSVSRTLDWFDRLASVDEVPRSVHGGLGLGIQGHFRNFGFSAISNTTFTLFTNADVTNLGLDTTGLDQLLVNIPAGANPGVETTLKNQVAAFTAQNYWNNNNRAERFVDAFIIAGLDPSNSSTRGLILDVARLVDQGSGSFANNTSGNLTVGLSIQEFGFSYGHTIPMPFFKPLDNKLSLGATARYMMGVAYVHTIRYVDGFSTGSFGSVGDPVISHNFGLDLAADFRPFEFVRVAVMARNVTAPKFSAGPNFGDIKIRPQVRLGTSITPIEHLVLAMDVDLTENQIDTLPSYRSRMLSIGAEYDFSFGKPGAIALRFGTYNNMSDVIQNDWALTGGLGFRLYGFVLDLSGGASLATETIRTGITKSVKLPTRMNLGLGVKWEKSI